MNKESIVTGIKQNGPAFLFGALIGVAVVAAVVNREKIARTVDLALGRTKRSVVKNEYTERS